MNSVFIDEFVKWFVPFALGAAASGITIWLTMGRALVDAVRCLLRAEIIRQNEKWVEKGFCPVYAKQALSKAYTAYHSLKGNDVGTALYNETMALPEQKRCT